ncbi:hypothetical protein K439DRAFT_1637933 [Ramaria rubella]|nr:hypothetical protein K439DRAFT_1637933 [Ramaria rubella]
MRTAARPVPTELWLQIIREASYVPPEAYDVTGLDPFPPNGMPTVPLPVVLHQVLSTKLAMSRVCTTWHNICAEFMYDFIIVRNAATIPLLVDTLTHRTNLAMKVRRLELAYEPPSGDIVCMEGGVFNGATVKELACVAAELICACSRLRTLSLRSWGGCTAMLTGALLQAASTLECLELYPSQVGCYPSLVLLSELHPSYSGSLLLSYEDNSSTLFAGWHSEFILESNVEHTLSQALSENQVHSHTDNFATTRQAVISAHIPPTVLFCTLHLALQIDTLVFCRSAFHLMNQIGTRIPPWLHTLVFYLDELSISPLTLPHIKRIGLRGTRTPSPEEYDFVFNVLVGGSGSGDEHFPGLKLIRFMDVPLARMLEKRRMQFKLWDHRCRSKGVQLEDENGRLMIPGRL